MKILNVMFQKALGGIEQAFLDYDMALKHQGYEVVNLIHPKAKIRPYIKGNYQTLYNFSKYDFLALLKLQKLITNEQPDCIITHGGRAANLIKKIKHRPPFIAVSANYNFKSVIAADAIIAITNDMQLQLSKIVDDRVTIYQIPNMISLTPDCSFQMPHFRNPPVIGVIGRLAKEKSVDTLLRALSILKSKNVPFKLRIAGDGIERHHIEKLINDLGLNDHVQMIGWVDDKEEFYKSIDIFCLCSNQESFGIVVLEAFKYSKPSVLTMTLGPIEIATNGVDALLVPINDHQKIADSIIELVNSPDLAISLAKAAFKRAHDYSLSAISNKLQLVIEEVCARA